MMYFRRCPEPRIDRDLKPKEGAAILTMHPEVHRRQTRVGDIPCRTGNPSMPHA